MIPPVIKVIPPARLPSFFLGKNAGGIKIPTPKKLEISGPKSKVIASGFLRSARGNGVAIIEK